MTFCYIGRPVLVWPKYTVNREFSPRFQCRHFTDTKDMQTYIFVMLAHFGFTVISLLIHNINFCMKLLAQFLKDQILITLILLYFRLYKSWSFVALESILVVLAGTFQTVATEATFLLNSVLSPLPSLASPSPNPHRLLWGAASDWTQMGINHRTRKF